MATIYDDDRFFKRYSQMPRSQKGLAAAGEWPVFKTLLPDLKGKKCWIWAAVMVGIVGMLLHSGLIL